MTGMQALLDQMDGMLAVGLVVFLRVGAAMAVLPAFGERMVPVQVRLVVALAFAMVVAPAAPVDMQVPLDFDRAMRAVATETLAGLIIGIGLRFFVLALQTAGSIAAQSTSLSQILGGAAVEPLPAMGHILVIGGLALAVTLGLHVRIATLFVQSYAVLPALEFPSVAVVSEWGVAQVSAAFSLAFSLAVPFVILSMLYNLTLGVINRAMPQLMVAFVGAPVITFGGLFLLFLLSPFILSMWVGRLNGFIANPFGGG